MAVFKYNYFPDVHEVFNVLQKRHILERIDRPKIPVAFVYKNTKTDNIWCLMDSGADCIVLPQDIAVFLKINLTNSPEFDTQVVGGSTIKIKRHPIGVMFKGKMFHLSADFSDTHRFPILGRVFFKCFESVNFREPEKITELILTSASN